MCILFIAVKQHPHYPLIIAANRDEFHARLTSPSHFWPEGFLAGKDEQAGGTWMGLSPNGRFSALTNIRAPSTDRFDAKTRGELVVQALAADNDVAFTEQLKTHATQYNGYNLVYGTLDKLHVFNSHSLEHNELRPGVYGLSNAKLNTPWPKTQLGVSALNLACQNPFGLSTETLFSILKNAEKAPDHLLPETGIAQPWEKLLSSIFIQSPDYGTRSSTIVTVDNDNNVLWHEKTFSASGDVIGEVKEALSI